MVTSIGKPITHSTLLRDLLQAVLLPALNAVCKCAAHISNTANLSIGNMELPLGTWSGPHLPLEACH